MLGASEGLVCRLRDMDNNEVENRELVGMMSAIGCGRGCVFGRNFKLIQN